MRKILILGGTKEAVELARKLAAEGNHVTTSLAGRTKEPTVPVGEIRIGGFGGVEGLAAYLREHAIDLLIDATHPFAEQISLNAIEAARKTDTAIESHQREPWHQQHGDRWTEVSSLVEMRDTLPTGARVLLALGSQHIEGFNSCEDVFFLVRMVDPPRNPITLKDHRLLLGKPSTDWREELSLLQDHAITHIACRNSGGTGAYAKIRAARELGIDVVILRR